MRQAARSKADYDYNTLSKHHCKTAPAAFCVRNLNAAAVGFYDLVGDGQPQAEVILPAAGFFHPVETIENPFLVCVRDADAVILYADGEALFMPCEGQFDAALIRRIAYGIVQEDGDHLTDALRIHIAQRQCTVGQC